MSMRSDLRAAVELWQVLRQERVDVLHTHNPKPGLYGRVVGRLAGTPVVVNTVHGLYAAPNDPWAKRLLVYVLEALAARCSDAELVQNPEDLEVIRRLHMARRGRARLLGNGVDVDRFDPDRFPPTHRAVVRDEIGVDPDQVVIGTVGRLVAEKGYRELFAAVDRLGPEPAVVVVGPEDRSKRDALAEADIEEARRRGVLFLGQRDDVDRIYAAFDVFVLPSHREGFPRAAMEAAAMGLPVVATDIRGCRQVVEHGVNGLLVPPRDAGSLAGALRRLASDPALRAAMGSAGRRRAVAEFDERRVVRTVLDTYAEAARRKGLPWAETLEHVHG
jgi:glycosyltransferase involved in cell wall biosynthesis